MRLSWRLGLRVVLTLVVLALAWRWIGLRWDARSSATRPVTDLAATMPMNQSGGGVAPADAYEVYSALYQAPMDEPLAFRRIRSPIFRRWMAVALSRRRRMEREMTDAFVAANRQSHRWEQKFSIRRATSCYHRSELMQVRSCLATHGRDGRNARLTSRSSMCGFWECRDLTRRTLMRWCR